MLTVRLPRAAWEGTQTSCSKIVGFQQQRAERFQVPTPWIGRLDQAPILFVGANPSISFGEEYPDSTWGNEMIVDYFQETFTSAHEWIKSGTVRSSPTGSIPGRSRSGRRFGAAPASCWVEHRNRERTMP